MGNPFRQDPIGWRYFRPAVFARWLPFALAYPILIEWTLSGQSGLANHLPPASAGMRSVIAGCYVALFLSVFYTVRKISWFVLAGGSDVIGSYYIILFLILPVLNCFFDYLS